MREDTQEILKIDSLEIGYSSGGKRKILLPPLTASASRGELIAVVGRNGIGKSTLLRTITGLSAGLGGTITIDGRNLSEYHRAELAQKTGYISTEPVRVNNMTVFDLVALGRYPYSNWIGKIDEINRRVIFDSIRSAGISELAGRYLSELSDGERQRAMIARVLAQDTDLLIMDEPTAFLDVTSRYEIMHLLLNLVCRGKTIIFSTHDFNIALNQSDKIWLILDNGLAEGAPEDLLLSGYFSHLFNSPVVGFNPSDGSFYFNFERKGGIFIVGEGQVRRWTEKAVERAGFDISEIITDPYIKISGANGQITWLLIRNNTQTVCNSLYDLINRLKPVPD